MTALWLASVYGAVGRDEAVEKSHLGTGAHTTKGGRSIAGRPTAQPIAAIRTTRWSVGVVAGSLRE